VLEALARAVLRLTSGGIPLDAPLGDWQFALRGGDPIPLHGGQGDVEGTFNIIADFLIPLHTGLEPIDLVVGNGEGYPTLFGSTFILTVAFSAEGPVAEAVLTYGESGDPASPHFSDQTRLFAEKRLRPVLFTEDQIASDPELEVRRVSGPRRS
jgi:acyl-homoserine-lactone acylase